MRVIQDQTAVLAHWVYTKEEWEQFVRWRQRKGGLFRYWIARFTKTDKSALREVTITGQKVWVNDDVQTFMDQSHKLKRVNIRDCGDLNILEITYEHWQARKGEFKEIKIPVPKGKLKEAIEIMDCLSGYAF